MAVVVSTGSLKMVFHLSELRFVVIIVLLRSVRIDRWIKSSSPPSLSKEMPPSINVKALQLEFELENFNVTGEDVIDAMTFNNRIEEYISGRQRSDKTFIAASSYQEKTEHINK